MPSHSSFQANLYPSLLLFKANSRACLYLRLLVAPCQRVRADEGLGRGVYADGAYTAVPEITSSSEGEENDDEDLDAQDAYYAALKSRFLALRETLQLGRRMPSTRNGGTHYMELGCEQHSTSYGSD